MTTAIPMCPHGRPQGRPCPHCLGINSTGEVYRTIQKRSQNRPSKDVWFKDMALLVSRRSTCHRLAVGCVLVNARGHVLSTGYNGRAAGLPNCNEHSRDLASMAYPNACPNSDAPLGQPNGCESIHAEQNALLQCRDVYAVEICYCTHSPCLTCVKLLMNTGCRRIVFSVEYPHADAEGLWLAAGREWDRLS